MKNKELAKIRARNLADEDSGAVKRARCHSDPRIEGSFVRSFGLYRKVIAGVGTNSAINAALRVSLVFFDWTTYYEAPSPSPSGPEESLCLSRANNTPGAAGGPLFFVFCPHWQSFLSTVSG